MFDISLQISGCISFAIDLAPHFIPYFLSQDSETPHIKKCRSMPDLKGSDDIDQKEWIDYLKVALEPIDSLASWRYIKNLKNITCKERLENISWRKYSEREKYSLTLLDQGINSPSTAHMYFSRGFLNGPVLKMNDDRGGGTPKVKRSKRRFSQKSIRFKETVDYRSYDSLEDTLLDIPSDLDTTISSNCTFGFTEGKERIKNGEPGCSIIQQFLRKLRCKIKRIMIECTKRKYGIFELFLQFLIGKSTKSQSQRKNIPWEPTVLIEEHIKPDDKINVRATISQFLNRFYSFSQTYIQSTASASNRHIQGLNLWTAKKIRYFMTGVYTFFQKLSTYLKEKIMNYIWTIGNLYTSITSAIRQLFSILHYILVIIYPYACYLYQRLKKRLFRSVKLASCIIRRVIRWKKAVFISDLPTEIKWEIMKHLDYKSASRFCRILNMSEFDCLQYHQFFIQPFVKASESGIVNYIFSIIGWLFYQPLEVTSTEVDIWTVSYAIENMIGSDEKKFSVLVRNEKFRKYVSDEIVLALACKYGERSIVSQLIAEPKNDPSIGMDYAIRWAAYKGESEIIRLLLKDERVDPSIDSNKPLIFACEYGHVDAVDVLLRYSKVDPASQSNYAIEKACYNGHKEVVRRLLKDPRVDPTASRNHCLKLACKRNHMDIVQILLSDSRIRPRADDYKMIQRLMQRKNKKNIQYHPGFRNK